MARDLDHGDIGGDIELVDHAPDDDACHAAALAVPASEYLDADRAPSLGRHSGSPPR